MKLAHKTILVLLALAMAPGAFAQSNRVPGPSDYGSFSGFITERNIFDPSRQPHYSSDRPRVKVRHVSAGAPFLSLVGIMSYNKGTFAFFNGNDSDLKQVLPVSGKVAGYTVTEMTTSRVKLVSDDKKETLDLKVGDVLRQENGKWELSDSRDVPAETSPTASAGRDNSTATDAATVPSVADQPNEILKKLMELRQKENQ
jgi:hypothetical protein